MPQTWLSILIGFTLLVLAIPYVASIRHPQQKPLAAYLIFIFIFAVASVVLYSLLLLLSSILDLTAALKHPLPALVFLLLIFLPAIALARWQARKPPWRQVPPP